MVYLTNILRPKLKIADIIGSYGSGGRMVETLMQILTNLKVEILQPILVKGYPKKEDLKMLENLADEIFKKHKEQKIV